jgi:hypothetical protein
MTPAYYRTLAATWQRLAELEPSSLEKQRLQMRAAKCLRLADEAEKRGNPESNQR